jgi:hypothetical protein
MSHHYSGPDFGFPHGDALSLSQTLSCLAVDRESDDDRVQ